MRHFTIAALALSYLTACERVDSSRVATSEIEAHVEVVADGRRPTRVTARLDLDHAAFTYVELGGGDALSANVDGEVVRLSAAPALTDYLEYEARLSADWGPVEVVLHRPRDVGAALWAELPEPFELQRTEGVWSLSLDDIPLDWTHPTWGDLHLSVRGPCVRDFDAVVPDEGAWDLLPGDLVPRSSWGGGVCDLRVELERVEVGEVGRSLAGGSIVARQLRGIRLEVVP